MFLFVTGNVDRRNAHSCYYILRWFVCVRVGQSTTWTVWHNALFKLCSLLNTILKRRGNLLPQYSIMSLCIVMKNE